MRPRLTAVVVALAGTTLAFTASAQAALKVTWMPGVTSPGTPAHLNRVGVIKAGPPHARNVLVIEPGTSAGGAYFVPLAKWIVSRATDWQVWSVERRENLLEDQSELNLAKHGGATAAQVFDYYLGWITDPSMTHHVVGIPASSYAKRWGMGVAVGDASGAEAALLAPDGPSAGQRSGLLPAGLTPPVSATNLAQFGYALNVGTSPAALIAAQAHLGRGVSSTGGWDSAGALTPITRYAEMFSGNGVTGADGSEWYFPERLSLDLGGVGNGTPSGAQRALGLKTTLGRHLPKTLRIYGFGARLGGQAILNEAATLARQSHIPRRQVTLVDRHATYAHNDPIGAYPRNAFFSHLIAFLRSVSASAR